ncbi:hypothetical protein EJ05DRAFT_506669 [Pseudovirgaria hyperparasitica]|uniref:Uncharacterized protein n=1 Tax=Pseudovirgaria hyperparasitica TaxID=470096 RepID=A0A6A6WLK0_9PEZI|nr:uncharacterized protein EJ05DRAFT_506669 [Pseudovirgaria hyperparasitica]KAF2763028.1 hypothetical protein EJ05DRAFT_506669 [Pseudovirgaria hyperparasitica]
MSRRISQFSVSGSISKTRLYCYWRKRRNNDTHGFRSESRLDKSGLQGAYAGAQHWIVDEYVPRLSRSRVGGIRKYSEDNASTHSRENDWHELRRRRLAIWKRMLDEDPYKAVFGPSNSALNGKGWTHPLWNHIPKWMQEEFGIEQPTQQRRESTVKPDIVTNYNNSEESPKNDIRPTDRRADLGSEATPTEVPRTNKANNSECQYLYDPISGRMVMKNASTQSQMVSGKIGIDLDSADLPIKPYQSKINIIATDELTNSSTQQDRQTSTKHATTSHTQTSASTSTSLYSSAAGIQEVPQRQKKESEPTDQTDLSPFYSVGKSRTPTSTSSKLSSLPQDDIDFLQTEDIRSRIAYLRKRMETREQQTSKVTTADLEQRFDQLHKRQPVEAIEKPDMEYESRIKKSENAATETHATSNEELQLRDEKEQGSANATRLTTALQRMREHRGLQTRQSTMTGPADVSAYEAGNLPVPGFSLPRELSDLCRQMVKQTRQVESFIADLGLQIYQPSQTRELSKLDDQRDQLRGLLTDSESFITARKDINQRLFKIQAEIQQSLCSLKHMPAENYFDLQKARDLFLKHVQDDLSVLMKASERLKQLKGGLTGRFRLGTSEGTYPSMQGDGPISFKGLESYDIQHMSHLVQLEPLDSASREKSPAPITQAEKSVDGFSDGFDPFLARRLKNYEIQGRHKPRDYETQAPSVDPPDAAVESHDSAQDNLTRELEKYERSCTSSIRDGKDDLRAGLKDEMRESVTPGSDTSSIQLPSQAWDTSKQSGASMNTSPEHLRGVYNRYKQVRRQRHKLYKLCAKQGLLQPKLQQKGNLAKLYDHDTHMDARKLPLAQLSPGPTNLLTIPSLTSLKLITTGRSPRSPMAVIDLTSVTYSTSPTLSFEQAARRLHKPFRFVLHLSPDYSIVDAKPNLLVLRKNSSPEFKLDTEASTVSPASAREERERARNVNPVDGTTVPLPQLPQSPSGNFASLTGFVSFHQGAGREDGREEEREKRDVIRETREEGRGRKETRGGGVSRVFVAGITGATVCYVAGVLGELLR